MCLDLSFRLSAFLFFLLAIFLALLLRVLPLCICALWAQERCNVFLCVRVCVFYFLGLLLVKRRKARKEDKWVKGYF